MEDEYGVEVGAGAGIFPHSTSISIPSNPASNPDGSAFSISHASTGADMGQNHTWRADNLIQRKHGI